MDYSWRMPRELIWVESQRFMGFGCSECDWKFNPPASLDSGSFDEMKNKYQARRDQEFAAHVCAKHQRAVNPEAP